MNAHDSPEKERQHEHFRMKIEVIGVSKGEIGPVKKRARRNSPVSRLAPWLGKILPSEEIKGRAAGGEAQRLKDQQSFRIRENQENRRKKPENGRLVVGKKIDPPLGG